MDTNRTVATSAQMRRELNEFLTQNIDTPGVGWPRVNSGLTTMPRLVPEREARQLRVLIIGDLSLEAPVEVEATREELLESLKEVHGRPSPSWRLGPLRVGGFAAQAARVAVSLGARVSVCAAVPVPVPARIRGFLAEYGVDSRRLIGVPRRRSVRWIFHCSDGPVVLPRPAATLARCLSVPPRAVEEADVILADLSGFAGHSSIPQRLAEVVRRRRDGVTVGVRIDRHSDRRVFELTTEQAVWTVIRQQEAVRLSSPRVGWAHHGDEVALARDLCRRFGVAKLVLLAGADGAVFHRGSSCSYRVHTCPVEANGLHGAGDVLLAVAAMSSAFGAADRTCVRRGVAAATGYLAGLDPPTGLDELDAA